MILFLLIILIFTFIYLIFKKKNKELFNEITKKDLDDINLEINSKYKTILSEIYKINEFLGIKDQKETTTIVKPTTTTQAPTTTTQAPTTTTLAPTTTTVKPTTTTQSSQKTKESIKKSKTCNGKSEHENCKTYDKQLCNHRIVGKQVSLACPILCDTC